MQMIKLMLEYTKDLDVLYVEDDIELLKNTKELFENYFKSVTTATNGLDGIEKYSEYEKEHNSYFDIVITDINMPKMNGLDMSSEILSRNSMQSIIIITAYNEMDFLTKALELGADGFLSKPIDNTQLAKVMYKASKAISDHKFVDSHLNMMEEVNLQLEAQNRELLSKNAELEKSMRLLDTMHNKEQIIQQKNLLPEVQEMKIEDRYILQQLEELINNDLFELKDLLTEIDVNVIDIIENIDGVSSSDSLENLINLFAKYSSILHYYSFFDSLSGAMLNFSQIMSEYPLPKNKEDIKNIFIILESFLYVLSKWHEDMSSGDDTKINQFDASIISDMETIINMWTQNEDNYSDDDIDEIFDF